MGYRYHTQEKNIYIYDDLWLSITTHEKTNQVKRKKNMIYNKDYPWDHIEVFFKEPNKNFEEEIRETHLSKWCKIEGRIEELWHPISPDTKGFEVIAINLEGNENCKTESFFFDPQNPKKYYKISYEDCGPGPCSIFKNIEIF